MKKEEFFNITDCVIKHIDDFSLTRLVDLKQRVFDYLPNNQDITNFDSIFIKSIYSTENLYDYYIDNEGLIIRRKQLFSKTRFKIKLTDEEYDRKRLYIGHRFIPFVKKRLLPNKFNLIDEYENTFFQKAEKVSLLNAYKYVFMLTDIQLGECEVNNDSIQIYYFDISEWMSNTTFSKKDLIVLSAYDYDNGVYILEKYPEHRFKTEFFINQYKDNQLIEAITEVIRQEPFIPIDITLFKAFGKCEESVILQPGTPLEQLLLTGKRLSIQNDGDFPYLADNDIDFLSMAIDEANLDDDFVEEELSDLDIFLKKNNLSFSSDFIKIFIICLIKKEKKFDFNKIIEKISIKVCKTLLFNELCNDLKILLNNFCQKIIKEYSTYTINNKTLKLYKEIIEIKLKNVDFLKMISNKFITNDKEIEYVLPFLPIESLINGILKEFAANTQSLTDEKIESIKCKLKTIKSGFTNITSEINKRLAN